MSEEKKELVNILLKFIVVFIVIGICIGFVKLFTFRDPVKKEEPSLPAVTEDLVKKLYEYIPRKNEYGVMTMYSKLYTTANNINPKVKLSSIYQYFSVHNKIRLEEISDEEKVILSIGGEPIYKIKESLFEETFHKIYGKNVNYEKMSFDIDYETSGVFKDDYVYIYTKTSPFTKKNIEIYRNMLSYTVADSGNTIIIYDYYLRCNKDTKECFNDEKEESKNSNIKYEADLDLTNNKYLKQYEHIYKYDEETQSYYWYSSQESR